MAEVEKPAASDAVAAQPTLRRAAKSPGPIGTLLVTLAICFACSLLVSVATVLLRPIQIENRQRARKAQIADILQRQPGLRELVGDLATSSLEERVVDLQTGDFAEDIDPAGLDPVEAARNPDTSRLIPPDKDIAGIARTAQHAAVTVVWRDRALEAIVLPIYGRGYASVIRGSIALAGDGNTVLGLVISEHDETPGIGSEVAETDWTELWAQKKLRDEQGQFRFHVAVDETKGPDHDASFHVDGISGATRSSEGVGNMVRFWLGDNGFGPLLDRIRGGQLR